MSIFKKISLLFFFSLILMTYLAYQTNKTVEDKISTLYKQKYIQVSKEFFNYIANADIEKLSKRAKSLHFVKKDIHIAKNYKVVFEDILSFGDIKIYQKDGLYFLYIKYLNDEFIFFDTLQKKDAQNKTLLNYLFSADILLLFIIFVLIINMLKPLKSITISIKKFGTGDYSYRIKELKQDDEISQVTKEFNQMAINIENLLISREQLLRDVSHELKTPISKLKIALDMQEKNKYTNILKEATNQIDVLTDELLNAEKLSSGRVELHKQWYDIETILATTLSSMLIKDESILNITIKDNTALFVDIKYFSMAIKNLIDNAIKYRNDGTVSILVDKEKIEIKNIGMALKYDLEYYLKAFTQGDSSRHGKGYGIGLNIVKNSLKEHDLKLKYKHIEGFNIFTILLNYNE